jgi:hypothetical protein
MTESQPSVLADESEQRRLAAKARRENAQLADPFDRSTPRDVWQEVQQDNREGSRALVAFADNGDRINIPAVDFFEAVPREDVCRIYVRGLNGEDRPHALGANMLEIAASLNELTRGYRPVVFVGASLGAFWAMLLGTLASADVVFVVNPVCSLEVGVLDEAGKEAWVKPAQNLPDKWRDAYGDMRTLWERHQPPPVLGYYASGLHQYAVQAALMVDLPNVQLKSVEAHAPMAALAESGELHSVVSALLFPGPGGLGHLQRRRQDADN